MNQKLCFRVPGVTALITVLMLIFSSAIQAATTIEYIGQDTGIMDRVTDSGALLSDVLTDLNQECSDSSLDETFDKLQKDLDKGKITEDSEKFLKERAKKYFKCLKEAVKALKKSDVISKDEEKVLKNIIKQAKKDGTISDPEPMTESTVNGRITLPNGVVLDGVEVLATSGSDAASGISVGGMFSLELEADTEYVLQLSGEGLADQILPVMSPALGSAISIEITMIARGAEQTFTAGTGYLTDADGAAVDVNGIEWVDAAGNPVIGQVTATITPVDVSNSAALGAFPGEFSGIATGAADDDAIVSYGVVEFEFSQNGAPIQPAPGELVTVLIPIYFDAGQDGVPFVGGEEIPLWSLNEATGIWEQDGMGVVVSSAESPSGWALQADVSHFSWWNCDVSMNAADAFVTVFGDQAGSAVVKATTDANIGWRPNAVETVLAIGVTSGALNVPSTGEVCFSADITYDDGTEAATQEVCVNPPANGVVNIELNAPILGPLAIIATPMSEIEGFVNFPVDRVRLFPTSLETSVSYSIVGGSLPTGLSLIQTTPTRAEIAGVPTQAGLFSVTVQGDDGAETASVVVNYNISSDVPPPLFIDDFFYVSLIDTNDSYDLNDNLDLVNGGAADSWMLLEYVEGGPIPLWLDLDTSSGIMTINTIVDSYWFGRIRVTNASGDADSFIDICAGNFCGGDQPQ